MRSGVNRRRPAGVENPRLLVCFPQIDDEPVPGREDQPPAPPIPPHPPSPLVLLSAPLECPPRDGMSDTPMIWLSRIIRS